MDNFFDTMGGPDWTFNRGWTDKGGELCDRFGVTVEQGHVTKISLAGNNLRGVPTNMYVVLQARFCFHV